MHERHLRTARPPYPYYNGMTFAEWSATFNELMARFGAIDLAAIKLGRPAQFKYYLTGYLPHDIVLLWCQNIIRINQVKASRTRSGKHESTGR